MIYYPTSRLAVQRLCLRLPAEFFPQLLPGAYKLTFIGLYDYQ